MINNILFIALVVLAVTEVIFTVGFFFILLSKIDEVKFDYEFFKDMIKANREITDRLVETVSEEAETYEHMYELCDLMADQNNKIVEQYNIILKQYEIFYDAFKTINDNYKKLLSCWKDVTNSSDNASEQFRLCALELKRYADILAPWVIDSDQLGDEYVNGVNGIIYTADTGQ